MTTFSFWAPAAFGEYGKHGREGPGKDTISALEYHTTFHQLAHDATHWPDINWK